MFATHVVGARQCVRQRWASQNIMPAPRIGEFEGEVRMATGYDLGSKGAGEPRHIRREPRGDRLGIDAVSGCINHAAKLLVVASGIVSA